jgi:hypothetical protein
VGCAALALELPAFGGCGAVVVAAAQGLRDRVSLDRARASLAFAFGILTVACFWLMQRIPFDPFSLLADRRELLLMPLYWLAIPAPTWLLDEPAREAEVVDCYNPDCPGGPVEKGGVDDTDHKRCIQARREAERRRDQSHRDGRTHRPVRRSSRLLSAVRGRVVPSIQYERDDDARTAARGHPTGVG